MFPGIAYTEAFIVDRIFTSSFVLSLDLSLENVYRKVWMPRHAEGEPMKVIYRLRGLLGDATEDMIESLNAGDAGSSEDAEQVYKMAEVLAERNGAGMKVRV